MNQPNLNSELLRTFVTVVEVDGFIKASEHLHKTQSTVSQHIKRLEQETGVELFAAQGRRRVLTAAGEILLGYAKRMLALQDDALFAVKQTDIEEEIRLGVSQGLSEGIFPELLGRFTRAYPGVRLFVETGHSNDIIQRYDRNEFDLALTMEREPQNGHVIGTEDMIWIGCEGYEWSGNRPLPLLSFVARCQFRESSIQSLDRAGIPWNLVYTSTSLPGLMAAVRAGLGVTVRARNAISAGTEIVTPRIALPELPQIHVVLRNRTMNQAADILAGELSVSSVKAA